MSRCMCGRDMRDGDLALSGERSQIDTTNVCDRNRSLLSSIPVSRTIIVAAQSMYLDSLLNRRGRYVENPGRDCDTLSTEQLRAHRLEPFDRRDPWAKSR